MDSLRARLEESENLLNVGLGSTTQLEAQITKYKTENVSLSAEAEKLKNAAKDEEEKRTKAVSLLKTVRQKLVKAEKERDDAVKELAGEKEMVKAERDNGHLECEKLQGELNRVKSERELALAQAKLQFDKDLAILMQQNEKELAGLKVQHEADVSAMKVGI